MNIGIAGAGLIGRLCAYLLAKQGYHISVFDCATSPYDPIAAGFAATGLLSYIDAPEGGEPHSIYQLGERSLALWPTIAATLSIDLHCTGSLLLAKHGDEDNAQSLLTSLSKYLPKEQLAKQLSLKQLTEKEPFIHGVAHAWEFSSGGHIDTRQAMMALYNSCGSVEWHWQCPVQKLSPGKIHTQQESYSFDWVIDARGLGARKVKFPNKHTVSCQNVRGVRGNSIYLQTEQHCLNRPIRLVHPHYKICLVPRHSTIVVSGIRDEKGENRSDISVQTMLELLNTASSILPNITTARIIHTEHHLLPALLDYLPRLEISDGIIRINGLFQHGWLVAPAIAEQTVQAISKGHAALT